MAPAVGCHEVRYDKKEDEMGKYGGEIGEAWGRGEVGCQTRMIASAADMEVEGKWGKERRRIDGTPRWTESFERVKGYQTALGEALKRWGGVMKENAGKQSHGRRTAGKRVKIRIYVR